MKNKILLKSYIAISTLFSILFVLVVVSTSVGIFKEKREKEHRLLVERENTKICANNISVTTSSAFYDDESLPLKFQYPQAYKAGFSTTTRVDGGGYIPSDKWWHVSGGPRDFSGSVSIKKIKIKDPTQYTAENILFSKVPAPIGGDTLVVYDQSWKRVGDLFVVSQVYDRLSGGYTVVGESKVISEQEGKASFSDRNEYSISNGYRYLFIYKDSAYIMESYSACGKAKELLDNVAKTVKLK